MLAGIVVKKKNGGVLVKTDVGSVFPTKLLLRSYYDCARNFTLLDVSAWDSTLYTDNDLAFMPKPFVNDSITFKVTANNIVLGSNSKLTSENIKPHMEYNLSSIYGWKDAHSGT